MSNNLQIATCYANFNVTFRLETGIQILALYRFSFFNVRNETVNEERVCVAHIVLFFTLNMQNREYVVDCTVFIPRQPNEKANVKAWNILSDISFEKYPLYMFSIYKNVVPFVSLSVCEIPFWSKISKLSNDMNSVFKWYPYCSKI